MPLTKQQIFNKVANHLLKQNAKSMSPSKTVCMYRDADGKSCAVGCLIRSKHYTADIEGTMVRRTSVLRVLEKCGIAIEDFDTVQLLVELQETHDQFPADTWRAKLGNVAKSNNLSTKWIKHAL